MGGGGANCKALAPAGQARRGLVGRLHSSPSPHVGLPDMSARFEIRKRARKKRLPSPACPAGSKVSLPATQRPNVILAATFGRRNPEPVCNVLNPSATSRTIRQTNDKLPALPARMPRPGIPTPAALRSDESVSGRRIVHMRHRHGNRPHNDSEFSRSAVCTMRNRSDPELPSSPNS